AGGADCQLRPPRVCLYFQRRTSPVNRVRPTEIAMVVGLIAAGVVVRLAFELIPNFAPVAAIALFAGFAIRNRMLAAAAPLGVMLLSDAIIGGYHLAVMATVYASLALPVLAGHWLRSFRAGTPRTVAALMGSSLA